MQGRAATGAVMSRYTKSVWRWAIALLLSSMIMALGIVAVWFGKSIFLFGLREAAYSNTFEHIFNICFGAVVLAGTALIPLVLLRFTLKRLFVKQDGP